MSHLLKKVTDLEKRMGIKDGCTVIHIVNYDHSFISEGYFTDMHDQKQYLEWRLENIKKEIDHTSTPYQTYMLTKEDIQEHLDAFRRKQEIMIKLAKDYEEDYRKELCMPH